MKKSSIILLVLLLGACTKQSLKTAYDKQATYIENFVAAQMKKDTTATLTESGGAYRLTLHDTLKNQPAPLEWGGKVSLLYACYTLTGATISTSNLVATNIKEVATHAGWKLTDTTIYKPDTLTLNKNLVPGLADGLEGVRPYDEGYILFTGQYGFGSAEKGTIPANSALAYYFFIENVANEK